MTRTSVKARKPTLDSVEDGNFMEFTAMNKSNGEEKMDDGLVSNVTSELKMEDSDAEVGKKRTKNVTSRGKTKKIKGSSDKENDGSKDSKGGLRKSLLKSPMTSPKSEKKASIKTSDSSDNGSVTKAMNKSNGQEKMDDDLVSNVCFEVGKNRTKYVTSRDKTKRIKGSRDKDSDGSNDLEGRPRKSSLKSSMTSPKSQKEVSFKTSSDNSDNGSVTEDLERESIKSLRKPPMKSPQSLRKSIGKKAAANNDIRKSKNKNKTPEKGDKRSSEDSDSESVTEEENNEDLERNSSKLSLNVSGKSIKTPRKSIKMKDSAKSDSKAKTPKKANNKSEDSDDEPVSDGKTFEVKKIMEVHRCRDGTREFLVRWEGYTPDDDTWEPEAHLNCPELLKAFMKKLEKAKNIPLRELREKNQAKTVVAAKRRKGLRNIDLRPFYME